MKRFIAVAAAAFILLASVFTGSAYADPASSGDGLYTQIPYVPKYTGDLSDKSRVILMDLETGNALIEQNGDVRAYPASTTKIMTALLLIENTEDDQWDVPLPPLEAVNSEQSKKGSQLGLIVGDQPTRRDLLYGILLPSGCDCAYVTSCLIAGSEEDFVFMMNSRAAEIGMGNSGYENSYGLASNGHYTTAEDMAILIRHAMQYPLFRSTVSTSYKTLKIPNGSRIRSVGAKNTNHLLHRDSADYYPYAIGVKTGTSMLADHCLTAAARKDGLELLSIILNSDDNSERYGFTKEILEWGFDYYASEGGLYSMTVTNALFKAARGGCNIYSVPETDASDSVPYATVEGGAGIRVGAYRYDSSGKLWYMVWHNDSFGWAKSEELVFVCYINDIRFETGTALNCVTGSGKDLTIDGVVSSRHNVKVVTLTVYDSNGTPVTGGSNYPSASCTHTLWGTTADQDVDLSILPAGDYTCVTRIEAVAYVPDAPDREYMVTEEKSVLRIVESSETSTASGDQAFGDIAYCYNSNTGSGAPEGGFAEKGGSFTASSELPSKPGCSFAGWNTSADGSGKTYMPGDSVPASENITLYAMWGAAESEWRISADAEAKGSLLSLSGFVENSAGITAVEIAVSPEGTNSAPVYSKSIACRTNRIDLTEFNEELSTALPNEGSFKIVMKAAAGVEEMGTVFEKTFSLSNKRIYTLTLIPEGGVLPAEYTDIEVIEGEAFGELPLPERDEYEFTGWYDSEGKLIVSDSIVPSVEESSIELHAGWEQGENGHGGSAKKKAFPLWGWFAGGAGLIVILVILMIIIVKKPDKNAADRS